MFTRIRRGLVAIGVLLLVSGGASIFSLPDHEVLYDPQPPLVSCTQSGCLSIYTLEVGNTGRQLQEHVRVRLRTAAVQASMLPLAVRTFGKVPRGVNVQDEGDVRTVDLGALKPQERVELRLVYRDRDPTARRDWREMLVAVEAATGKVRQGNPGGVLLGRILYTAFSGCAPAGCDPS